ncbi:MAG: glycosyltransferase family 2 protein [Paludibacteraceae bacterium]|nr:glycosyltransferase family 2 protein [Paludibacteraceae bacterium]
MTMLHILMSTYNGERYLAEQLDSILAQTYTDWCLFIRDDGSKDGTKAILDAYAAKDPRITIVRDTENVGACRSFERLLEQCGGADYYAFADQDDVWDADKLAICMQVIRAQEKAYPGKPIVVHTDLRVVDEQLQNMAPSFWKYSNIQADLIDAHPHYLAICNSVTGCAMLFNEAARACALPMSKDAYMHDAWVALMTVCRGGQLVPVHRAPIAYRQHEGNVLGAVHYSTFGRSVSRRVYEAGISYCRSRGYVYRNKLHFLLWKTIYFIHRTLRGNRA